MKLDYVVHNVSEAPKAVTATVNGEDISATITALVVELTSADGKHGSLTLRFVGSEVEEAKETFIVDKTVTVSIA